jgi:APA family basic amino acid/polyamine antiporter
VLGARLPAHFVGATGATGAISSAAPSAGALLRALAAGLFAFGGWHMVTYTAGETRDAARTIPRALLLGLPIVVASYLALNAMYLYVLPVQAVVRSTRVAADAADAVLGSGGAGVMSALVLFSSFGALSGLVLTAPRAYQRMAEDGLAFRWLGSVHPRWRTPSRAIVLQAIWGSVLVLTGSYRELVARVVYTEWIFFAVLALGLLRLRARPGYYPAWRVPAAPVLAPAFALVALTVAVEEIAARPGPRLLGLALVAAGIPVYLILVHARKGEPA